MADVIKRLFDDIIVEAFFIEDDIWFDDAATSISFGNAIGFFHVLGIKEFMTFLTEITMDAAVEL